MLVFSCFGCVVHHPWSCIFPYPQLILLRPTDIRLTLACTTIEAVFTDHEQ